MHVPALHSNATNSASNNQPSSPTQPNTTQPHPNQHPTHSNVSTPLHPQPTQHHPSPPHTKNQTRQGLRPRGPGVLPLHEELRRRPRAPPPAARQAAAGHHRQELWDAGLLQVGGRGRRGAASCICLHHLPSLTLFVTLNLSSASPTARHSIRHPSITRVTPSVTPPPGATWTASARRSTSWPSRTSATPVRGGGDWIGLDRIRCSMMRYESSCSPRKRGR
jgi:hypothetical protein